MMKRPPSSGGIGNKFIIPSDTEIMAVNSRKAQIPASAADFEITAMPISEVELDTVSAIVAGLKSPATAQITAHK